MRSEEWDGKAWLRMVSTAHQTADAVSWGVGGGH
jgi:hypothetical protein